MKLTYKELLSQDQKKLRAKILELLGSEGLSLMAMAKQIGMPYSTFRLWFVSGKDIEGYKNLYKIISYIELKEPESKIVKGQLKIK